MHPLLSQALQEAYAACYTDAEVVDTLEVRHVVGYEVELTNPPIYLCKGFIDRTFAIEDSSVVTFKAAAFSFDLPAQDSTGARNFSVNIENVNGEVVRFIQQARALNKPIQLLYRTYIASTGLIGPQNPRPIRMDVIAAVTTIKGSNLTATVADVVNRPFPNAFYSFAAFQGLRG